MRHGLMSLLQDFATQVVSVICVSCFRSVPGCAYIPLSVVDVERHAACVFQCVCVLMITKRVSFHFHHGKKASLRRLHAERGGFGSFAAMNAGMDFACVPFKVASCMFLFKGRMSYLQSMMMEGRLSTNQERSLNLWRRIYMHETQGTKCRKTISISSHFFTCFELHSYQPTQTCFIPK